MQRPDLILSNGGVQIQINGKTFVLYQDTSPAVALFLAMDDFMSLVSKLTIGFEFSYNIKIRWCDRW